MTTFEAFYRDNLRLVYATALASTREQARAEDLSQETFLRAWRSYPQVRELEPPAQRAWLLTTVRHLATDLWRRQAVETNSQVEAEAPPAPPAELRVDVLQAVSELAEEDRQLVVMRYLQEMNSREIGESLGIPEGTVRRRLSDCREQLARRLAQWAPPSRKQEAGSEKPEAERGSPCAAESARPSARPAAREK